jgi:hypothetical protein
MQRSIFWSENNSYYPPPPSENDIVSPSHDASFFDSYHRAFFALILPYFAFFAFILPFYFPCSIFLSPFFLFLPFQVHVRVHERIYIHVSLSMQHKQAA